MKYFLLISFIALTSCASLPVVSSSAEQKTSINEYTYYDASSKMHYEISNDTDYLHIKLNTADFASITKVLKTGLTVYFDVNGKKNKNISLEYPIANKHNSLNRDKSSLSSTRNRSFELDKMISQRTKDAIFNHYEDSEKFLVEFNNSGIKVGIQSKNNNEIVYDLRIPFAMIIEGGLNELSNLSLGIESGKLTMPNAGGPKQGGMSGGGRSGGMSGGGKRGGGMKGGGQRPAGMDMSAMTTPVKIWIKVDLYKN